MLTQQMMEVLVSVARLPEAYRKLRTTQLSESYRHVLTCSHALEAFNVLLGQVELESVSEKGQATVRAAERRAERDEAAVTVGVSD